MASSDDPRRLLLEAAGQIFAEKGLKGATVRKICERAGVNIAAINYYFRDKERLYVEAVKEATCASKVHEDPPSWPSGTPPSEKLREFIHVFVSRLLSQERPAWHGPLMMREMAQPTAACAELVRDYIRPTATVLMEILGALLPPEAPRQKVFLSAFSIVGQCMHHVHCKPIIQLLVGEEEYAKLTADVVADHIAEFSLAALGLKAPRPKASRLQGGRP